MLKFGIKVGIAAGTVYYLSEQGVWKNSDEAHKVYDKLNTALSPYVKQVTEKVPIEIPNLPSTDQVSYLTKQYWNKGVLTTFEYLSNLPETVNTWTKKGINAARENPEIKKFIDSFSESPQQSAPADKKK